MVMVGRRVLTRSGEHERMMRLLAASARTAKLRAFDDALATAAEEVRLMTGATAVMCCSLTAKGAWVGMVDDTEGARPADADAIAALRELMTDNETVREIELHDRVRNTRLSLPPARSVVVAAAGEVSVPLVVGA